MRIRRVVTGQRADGTSVFVSDRPVDPITVALIPGAELHALWDSDEAVRLPTDGSRPAAPGWFPPAAGFRFAMVTLPPDSTPPPAGLAMDAALAEMGAKLPGLLEVLERDSPGMHRSDTIDFEYVVAGEIWLELDDGAELHLRAGDTVVQNGTRHAWRNKSSEPCVMAVAIVGARRD